MWDDTISFTFSMPMSFSWQCGWHSNILIGHNKDEKAASETVSMEQSSSLGLLYM